MKLSRTWTASAMEDRHYRPRADQIFAAGTGRRSKLKASEQEARRLVARPISGE